MQGDLWTDDELRSAVETYLYVLRLQHVEIQYSESDITKFLLSGPLKHRNDASIRYRMRNISSVMSTRGWPTVALYSPAHQVGSGVRARIEAILDSSPSLVHSLQGPDKFRADPNFPPNSDERNDAISRLVLLEESLEQLRDEFVGIGHNQPPEPIDEIAPSMQDLLATKEDIRELKNELLKQSPDVALIEQKRSRIATFGLKIANWVGERLTKFTDAALVTLAPVVIVKATNILPLLSDAISAVSRFLQHLLH